jgi:hypothetical protein
MTDVEPQKVAAIRSAVADRLGLDSDEIEVDERTVPGSSEDEPFYVTVRLPRKEGLTDEAVEAAVVAVDKVMWFPPRVSHAAPLGVQALDQKRFQ